MQPLLFDRLAGARRVLLAGCGGGYDVFGAVPLAVALRKRGVGVCFASSSFTYLDGLEGATPHPGVPNMYRVTRASATERTYCPEAWLADFLDGEGSSPNAVWCFDKTGAAPLRTAYETLVREEGIDAIVLVDGGVDSILRGDEISLGTPSEDLASIAAVSTMTPSVPAFLMCYGMGSEMRDGISHAQVLERMAELTREGGFLGLSALTPGTAEAEAYAAAVTHTFANQPGKKSHVQAVVLDALRGNFGARGPHVWISPLLTMLFFFDLATVARTHLLLRHLIDTVSIWDVARILEARHYMLTVRDGSPIPI